MSITGHKSSTSLETYQRVSTPEKIEMGLTLGNSLVTSNAIALYTPPQELQQQEHMPNIPVNAPPILPLEANVATGQSDTPQMELSDQDLMNIIQQTENDHQLMMSQNKEVTTTDGSSTMVSTNTIVVSKKTSPQMPMFSGCTISGNITININK